jgi:hypothetical protein
MENFAVASGEEEQGDILMLARAPCELKCGKLPTAA